MNVTTQRNVFAVTTALLLIALVVMVGVVGPGAAGGQNKAKGHGLGLTADGKLYVANEDELAIDPLSPGQSVVGSGRLLNGMTIENSGGNDM
jgi:hypothetical protein